MRSIRTVLEAAPPEAVAAHPEAVGAAVAARSCIEASRSDDPVVGEELQELPPGAETARHQLRTKQTMGAM